MEFIFFYFAALVILGIVVSRYGKRKKPMWLKIIVSLFLVYAIYLISATLKFYDNYIAPFVIFLESGVEVGFRRRMDSVVYN